MFKNKKGEQKEIEKIKTQSYPQFFEDNIIALTENVERYTDSDFNLPDISFKRSNCTIILFHNSNLESNKLLKIIAEAASVSTVKFGSVNLNSQRGISTAFTNISPESPFGSFRLQQIPFILVYRSGYPQAYYNGERSSSAIANYATTIACKPLYKEEMQKYGGVETTKNLSIESPKIYAPKTSSEEYSSREQMRTSSPEKIIPGKKVIQK